MAHSQPLRVGEKPWVKWSLIALALLLVAVLLLIPLLSIFQQAFANGISAYFSYFNDPDTRHAIWVNSGGGATDSANQSGVWCAALLASDPL